jgi:oxidase EvaA
VSVSIDGTDSRQWTQPMINQPEIGIVGILMKEFDGVLHCLMQAKMEPGNVPTLQLSPTVQATRSNYTRVHKGAAVRYLEYFTDRSRGRVLADALQSEQGAWFFRKRNRNMVVETTEDVELADDFVWLTIGQLHELMLRDNTVNMDSRTVLSCLPLRPEPAGAARAQAALHPMAELLSWLVENRARNQVRQQPVPLSSVSGWTTGPDAISHDEGRYFSVIGVNVTASSREVSSWMQPLLSPSGQGVCAFITKPIGEVPHLLVRARVEPGTLDVAEIGPTVQCLPSNYPSGREPRYLDYVRSARPGQIRYRTLQSEEGGRFYSAQNEYVIVEADESFGRDVPPDYCWVTPQQLTQLVRYSHYLNMECRTLLACLHAAGGVS